MYEFGDLVCVDSIPFRTTLDKSSKNIVYPVKCHYIVPDPGEWRATYLHENKRIALKDGFHRERMFYESNESMSQ